jgi:hypothetical protein
VIVLVILETTFAESPRSRWVRSEWIEADSQHMLNKNSSTRQRLACWYEPWHGWKPSEHRTVAKINKKKPRMEMDATYDCQEHADGSCRAHVLEAVLECQPMKNSDSRFCKSSKTC